jgi:hypothetical protein
MPITGKISAGNRNIGNPIRIDRPTETGQQRQRHEQIDKRDAHHTGMGPQQITCPFAHDSSSQH